MYLIIWEYRVKAGRLEDFEKIYNPDGAWAGLFKKGTGFLGTELLRDEKDPQRYLTIDRWMSPQDHDAFLSQWKTEYDLLDARCEDLCETETYLGRWDIVKR